MPGEEVNVTIGTCGACGGRVVGPGIWHSILPAPLVCEDCGAKPARHGPVIPMGPSKQQILSGTSFETVS